MAPQDDAPDMLMGHLRLPRVERNAEKVKDNRLRAVARRQGYVLVKSKIRDPRSPLYGTYGLIRSEGPVTADPPTEYGLTLGQVEQLLGEVPPGAVRTFRAVDRAGNVLGQTRAVDGFAAIAWVNSAVIHRSRPPLSFITIEEFREDEWRLFFESEIGVSRGV